MGSIKERLQRQKIALKDPRPDLKEDHELWNKLLAMAATEDEDMAGVLEIFRMCGTRLVPAKNSYMRVLRPQIGPGNWESKEEYERVRDNCLTDKTEWVKSLLQRL